MHHGHRLLILGLTFAPAVAFAHPGHDGSGFAAGLAHPLLGIDHLAAAAFTGAWAARRGGPARLAMPAAFLAAMIAGLLCAPLGIVAGGGVEGMIGVSVLLSGIGLACGSRLPATLCATLAGAFAFCHGLAHGAEQPAGTLAGYGAGLFVTTATLLAAGVLLATGADRLRAQRTLPQKL